MTKTNSPKTRNAFGFTSMLFTSQTEFFSKFARVISYGFLCGLEILWLFGTIIFRRHKSFPSPCRRAYHKYFYNVASHKSRIRTVALCRQLAVKQTLRI